jgi:endoglycosylceramidase
VIQRPAWEIGPWGPAAPATGTAPAGEDAHRSAQAAAAIATSLKRIDTSAPDHSRPPDSLRRVRRWLPISLLLGLAAAAPAAAAPLQVRGTHVVDGQGRTVILRGVNVVFKPPPYLPARDGPERTRFDARDVARLRAWGFNAIRLGITWKALMPAPGAVDRGYVNRLLAVARLAQRGGLYVLFDMHQDQWSERFEGNGAPDWATKDDGIAFSSLGPFPLNYFAPAVGRSFTNFYENRDGVRTRFVEAWAAVARAVRGNARVLGFDLFNEPSCELQVDPPCHVPPAADAYRRWLVPLYDQLIPAVRRADPTHPSAYEEGLQVNAGWPMLFGRAPLPRWPFPNVLLSHHVYCTSLVRPGVPCPVQERDAFAQAAAAARRNRVTPLLTEFGATDDVAALRRVADLADRHGEGWLYWQYKTYGDPTTAASAEPGGADAESLVDVTGRVKAAKLRVLSRAYPERISGTAAHWSYDDRTRQLRLSFVASRRADTVLALPVDLYPRGAGVEVLGGRGEAVTDVRNGFALIRAAGRVRVRVGPR